MDKSNLQIFQNVYSDALQRVAENIQTYEEKRQKLETLDLKYYVDFVTIPVLIPLGKKVLLRGKLMHTNNFTVALSDEYFVKCSIKQAEEIKKNRIRRVNECLQNFEKEREYLLNQTKGMQESVFNIDGKEIIERFDEEEEKKWREKHKVNVKKYKSLKNDNFAETHEDIMAKLDELELQEEIDGFDIETNKEKDNKPIFSHFSKEILMGTNDVVDNRNTNIEILEEFKLKGKDTNSESVSETKKVHDVISNDKIDNQMEEYKSRLEYKQTVLDKLQELKTKSPINCKSEEDVLRRLDELEEEEMLRDELDRLSENSSEECSEEGILLSDLEENGIDIQSNKKKNKISFNCPDQNTETLTLNFRHNTCSEEHDGHSAIDNNDKAVLKSPADIYSLYPECFNKPLKSILKSDSISNQISSLPNFTNDNIKVEEDCPTFSENTRIIIEDVVEQNNANRHIVKDVTRPISKFKAMRLKAKNANNT